MKIITIIMIVIMLIMRIKLNVMIKTKSII